ncbi:MAG: helix-turn-helix transcriptional regulator, partial [Elstera sp.]
MASRIRVCDLAKLCRLSTNYFCQAFRNTFGRSPHAYLIWRRLERVQQILRTTDRSLSDVALECGFSDQPHLTRLFRQNFGVTPGEWRRRLHA